MFGKDGRREATELVVLSILNAGPRYGYAISKEISVRSSGALRVTPGILYPLLHELEAKGLLRSYWDSVTANAGDDSRVRRVSNESEEHDGGRRRKWYALSVRGRKLLARRVDAHREMHALLDSFLPQLEGEGGR
ncbi:MAG: PadR family transcriptional regulator [Planctomycetota bacterium]